MRHMHRCGHGPFEHFRGRFGPVCNNHDRDDERREHGHRFGGTAPHLRGRRGLLDYGDLRLLVLAMLADGPRHGYELMKAIGERTGGSYQPSPGVIYPTLAYIEDMGFAVAEAEGGGRKAYRITDAGRDFLAANGTPLEEILARIDVAARNATSAEGQAKVAAAMEALKLALRHTLTEGTADAEKVAKIAAAIEAAAATVRDS